MRGGLPATVRLLLLLSLCSLGAPALTTERVTMPPTPIITTERVTMPPTTVITTEQVTTPVITTERVTMPPTTVITTERVTMPPTTAETVQTTERVTQRTTTVAITTTDRDTSSPWTTERGSTTLTPRPCPPVPTCSDDETGHLKPYPADCSKFVECYGGGETHVYVCPTGEHFSPEELLCMDPYLAYCPLCNPATLLRTPSKVIAPP